MSRTQKQIRTRALRLRRALLKEEELHGQIDDGAGKRYLIGPLFVQCGDIEAALDHYAWFENNCADDSGEPIHYLFWALALFRAGDVSGANNKLLETLIQNVYILPIMLGLPYSVHNIWHSSNWHEPNYPAKAPQELRPRFTDSERAWITGQIESDRFRLVMEEYISTYSALDKEHNVAKRHAILERWGEFRDQHFNFAG